MTKEENKMIKRQTELYDKIDKYFISKWKKATTAERIKIRGIQKAISELVELEYQLAIRE